MRRQTSPDDLTRNTQLIEQFRCVLSESAPQYVAFPGCRRHFVTLQLLDDVEGAVGSMKLRTRLHVLPVIQEPHEIARVHRLDLASQTPEGHSVDTRQNAPVAPLDLAAKG